MPKFIDLTGQRFGRLTVVSRSKNNKHNEVCWNCSCICQNVKTIRGKSLTSGKTQSCGCFHNEISSNQCKKNNKNLFKHGDINSRLYNIWHGMKQRTMNTKNKYYNDYGGRGITVCDEWKKDFIVFKKWALQNGYSDNLTIDRKNNNKGYNPENCRWADMKTQNNNTRSNNLITFNDKIQTLSQWADELRIERSILKYRLNHGWGIEKTFKTPVKKKNRKTKDNL